jgi:DNA-binding NarL/FixJ family response regulator
MNSSDTHHSGSPCKILLVEDHPMFREHLGQLINRELGMSVCGEADNIRDAMRLVHETRPDIAIVDITLRGSSGLELIKDIKAQGLEVNVLVLSMHDEELYAERALRAGAKGYITKNEASAEVARAIRCVMNGEVYASKQMTAKLLERKTQKRSSPEINGLETLADRELEVFQMLGRGKSTREIAQTLSLGESTVETYRARIKEKLQLRSAAELYLRAGQWVRDHGALPLLMERCCGAEGDRPCHLPIQRSFRQHAEINPPQIMSRRHRKTSQPKPAPPQTPARTPRSSQRNTWV